MWAKILIEIKKELYMYNVFLNLVNAGSFHVRERVFLLDPEDMALEMIHVLTVIQVLLTVDGGAPSLFFICRWRSKYFSGMHSCPETPRKKTGKSLNRNTEALI